MADSNFGFDGEEQMEEDNRIREYLSDLNNRTNDPEEMMYSNPRSRKLLYFCL